MWYLLGAIAFIAVCIAWYTRKQAARQERIISSPRMKQRDEKEARRKRVAQELEAEFQRRATILKPTSKPLFRDRTTRTNKAVRTATRVQPAPQVRVVRTTHEVVRERVVERSGSSGVTDALIAGGIGYAIGRAMSDDSPREVSRPYEGGGGDYGGGGSSGSWDSSSSSSDSSSSSSDSGGGGGGSDD